MTYLEAWEIAYNQSLGLFESSIFLYAVCFKGYHPIQHTARYFIIKPSNKDYYANIGLFREVLDKDLVNKIQAVFWSRKVSNVDLHEPEEEAALFHGNTWQVMTVEALIRHASENLP